MKGLYELALLAIMIMGFVGYQAATKKNQIIEQLSERIDKIEIPIVHDTVVVHDTIRDTVTKTIAAISYSSMIPSKVDTFEVYKGNTSVTVEYADGFFPIAHVNEYKILCNGRMIDGDDEKYSECIGEWVLTFKGERNE